MKSLKPSNWPFLKHFTIVSFISIAILSLSVLEFGFDNSIMSLVQAMDAFDDDFGMYKNKNHKDGMKAYKLSIFSAIGTPFRACLLFVALFIAERYGRWAVFVTMQLGSIAGAAILFTSRTFLQIAIGRVVLTSFSGWHDWLIPMYLAEIVPGPVRGSVIAFYMIFSYCGSLAAAIATYFCSHAYADARQYRIPFGLMLVTPLLCLALSFVLPESPRWLVRKGRHDEAVNVLRRLNGTKNGYSPEEEANLLRKSIAEDLATIGKWKDLVQGPNRRRTVIVVMCIALIQFTGQAFVTKYGTIFIKNIGAMDPMQFGLLERSLSIIGPLALMFIVDRVGRRSIYLTGATLYAVCLFLIGGIGTMDMHRVGNVIISLYIISAILHIVSYHGICMIVSAEAPHLRLRDKTLTVSYSMSYLGEFGVGFSLPFLLYDPANLQSKVGFIYGSVAILGVIWGYFYLPETRKRSLEELEDLWLVGVPVRKFGSYKHAHESRSSIGLRVSQLERHAGAGDLGSSSSSEDDDEDAPNERDLVVLVAEGVAEGKDAETVKRIEVIHEEDVTTPIKY